MARKLHVPERSCIACAKKVPKRELVRVVRTSEGEVAVDLTGKASGRGAYLCQSADCWNRAVDRGGLARSLKAEISSQDQDGIRTFYQDSIVRESIAKD